MELSISNKLFRNIKNDRWQHEFTEREKIGAGGFASVYKALNCFDDQTYAVKKIKLSFKDIRKNFEQELQKVLDEAKFLAKLNHENILRYYSSWLEATTKPIKVDKKAFSFRASLFKKQKSNANTLLVDTHLEPDSGVPSHEVDSPCVVFGDPENSVKVCEDSPKSEGEIEQNGLNDCAFRCKPSKFQERRINSPFKEDLKILTKTKFPASEPEDCNTPLIRGEKLENILLFIQTELCNDTLESYIEARNEVLLRLKKQNEEYQKKRKEYLREALVFAKQILNGLSHIHSHLVVHRDLKPSNIFIANKVCKIGDFGLVKQLVSFSPIENSPFPEKKSKMSAQDSSKDSLSGESVKDSSSSAKNFESDNETFITKNTGTRMYASPEQWMADKDTFDCRADIFSLGVTFLLLFHPMSTYMEKINIIKDGKEGRIPESLEKELPEVADIIKKMLSLEPSSRPSIEKILESLNLPSAIKSQLSGSIYFRKENALRWRKKFYQVVDGNFYLYARENDKKAENVYDLSLWKLTLEKNECPSSRRSPQAGHSADDCCQNKGWIKFENSDQLGFDIRQDNPDDNIGKLFQGFEDCSNSAKLC